MVTNPATPPDYSPPKLIAPLWHTVFVLSVLVGLSVSSAHSRNLSGMRSSSHIGNYVTVMIVEWLIAGFIWFGLRLRHVRVANLIGGSWSNVTAALRDVGLAVLFLIGSNIVLGILAHLLRASPNQAIRSIFPQGRAEILFYLQLTLTAGICEEIIFRGYLYRQFSAITGSLTAGLLLQGIVFGAAHGYQGPKYMVIIAVYGCLFGLLAQWRRSLRPGMMAHFLQDGIMGLIGRHLMR
jgi:CAAX protease family protein